MDLSAALYTKKITEKDGVYYDKDSNPYNGKVYVPFNIMYKNHLQQTNNFNGPKEIFTLKDGVRHGSYLGFYSPTIRDGETAKPGMDSVRGEYFEGKMVGTWVYFEKDGEGVLREVSYE